jgi:hypothetical protein
VRQVQILVCKEVKRAAGGGVRCTCIELPRTTGGGESEFHLRVDGKSVVSKLDAAEESEQPASVRRM